MDEFEIVDDTPEMRESDEWCDFHSYDPAHIDCLPGDGGEHV